MVDTLFANMDSEAPNLPPIGRFTIPPPTEELERASASNLRRYLVDGMTREGHAPIYDHGSFLIWEPETRLWTKVSEEDVQATILDWDGAVNVYTGEKEGEAQYKKLSLSTTLTKGVVEAAQWAVSGLGKFDDAHPGVALADDFLKVEGDKLVHSTLGAEHFQTFAHPFTYLESKTCKTPHFTRFLKEQLADDDALFLQEWLGAAILGIATRYHRIALLHGPRGCGKSTLIDIFTRAFPVGSVTNIPLHKWGDDTYLCHLAGARLNVVAELPDERIRQLDRLKSIPEGTTLQVRNLYQSAFTFEPKAAHIFACNSIPDMPGFQDAVGDRLAPILMDSRGQGSVRGTSKDDLDLKSKIINQELPGVVYWALEGARRLLQRGKMEIPTTIQEQLEELSQDADALGAWLNERTDMGESKGWTSSSLLHSDFCDWCDSSKHSKMSSTSFSKRLKQHSGKDRKPFGFKRSGNSQFQLELLTQTN